MTKENEVNPIKASPSGAGCWIDGHWGQYGPARLCQIALELGWNDDIATEMPFQIQSRSTADLVEQKLASMSPSEIDEPTDSEEEEIIWASDVAEAWLNNNIAPEGFSFGWFDGEFFLWADAQWEDGE